MPYRGGYKDTTGEDGAIQEVDIEAPSLRQDSNPKTYGPDCDYLVDVQTPFFHFDLLGAVRAAECGVSRSYSSGSDHGGGASSKSRAI